MEYNGKSTEKECARGKKREKGGQQKSIQRLHRKIICIYIPIVYASREVHKYTFYVNSSLDPCTHAYHTRIYWYALVYFTA